MGEQTAEKSSRLVPLDRSVYFLAALAVLVHFLFNGNTATSVTNSTTQPVASISPGAMWIMRRW